MSEDYGAKMKFLATIMSEVILLRDFRCYTISPIYSFVFKLFIASLNCLLFREVVVECVSYLKQEMTVLQ